MEKIVSESHSMKILHTSKESVKYGTVRIPNIAYMSNKILKNY